MRTGIYGGSFNPMHIGHIELGGWLLEQGYLDEMWFLVSPQNPMKRQSDLLDDDMRLHLARLSVDSYQRNHKTRVRFAKRRGGQRERAEGENEDRRFHGVSEVPRAGRVSGGS